MVVHVDPTWRRGQPRQRAITAFSSTSPTTHHPSPTHLNHRVEHASRQRPKDKALEASDSCCQAGTQSHAIDTGDRSEEGVKGEGGRWEDWGGWKGRGGRGEEEVTQRGGTDDEASKHLCDADGQTGVRHSRKIKGMHAQLLDDKSGMTNRSFSRVPN